VGSAKENITAHRIVLCSWSETFRVMLENDVWKESHQQELPVAVDEKEVAVFKKMLQYMVCWRHLITDLCVVYRNS
jgi:hypothetical protein